MADVIYKIKLRIVGGGFPKSGFLLPGSASHRYNGFGQLHMIGNDLVWMGPDSWRTENASWTEGYQVRPMGVLSAPVIRELN